MANLYIRDDAKAYLDFSAPYNYDAVCFLLPYGDQQKEDYLKLLKPMELTTWYQMLYFRNPYQEWCYNFPKTYGTSFPFHRLMFIASIFGCTAVLLLSRSIFGSSWAGIPPSRGILFLFGYVFGESYPFNTKFVQNCHRNNLQHSSCVP